MTRESWQVKATEVIEDLERLVAEYGDGDADIPDPLEAKWHYPLDRIEFDREEQKYHFVSDR